MPGTPTNLARTRVRTAALGLLAAVPLVAGAGHLASAGAAVPTGGAVAPTPNATVAVTATGLVYTGLGAANNVMVNLVGGRFVITDSAPITAGTGCLPTSKGVFEVSCQVPVNANGTPKSFRVVGGGGDDVIRNTTAIGMRADGGTGNDVLEGGSGSDNLDDSFGRDTLRGNDGNDTLSTELSQQDGLVDVLEGGAGDDDLWAGPNDDILRGGAQDDTMRGGLGADHFDGGSGAHDAVAYLDGAHDPYARLVVSIDLHADDGLRALGASSSQEGDFVTTTVEDVFGGHGNDVLFGSSANNLLSGNLGNDVIEGLLGKDVVDGGPGDDTLASNQLFGAPVADGAIDTVQGNLGTDSCRVPFPTVEADLVACETVNQD
jgi:Ca2+-binding RTX toxin-like protein